MRGLTTGNLGFIAYPSQTTFSNTGCSFVGEPSASPLPTVLPTGAVFCHSSVRQGVLPRMLREILDTRVMVKKAMKRYLGVNSTIPMSKQRTLQNVLHARQLALKMIANVTYGYTAASFSGRMPCVELADAIVKAARKTLEHAISRVENESKLWSNAKVVYGDTDSLFVHLPGKTLSEAFTIGRQMAKLISDANPKDVVLKFEKVLKIFFQAFAYFNPSFIRYIAHRFLFQRNDMLALPLKMNSKASPTSTPRFPFLD